jgi:hypothetical protein
MWRKLAREGAAGRLSDGHRAIRKITIFCLPAHDARGGIRYPGTYPPAQALQNVPIVGLFCDNVSKSFH